MLQRKKIIPQLMSGVTFHFEHKRGVGLFYAKKKEFSP